MDRNSESIGFRIKKMNNLIIRNIRAKMAKDGLDELTIMHGWIMGFLYQNEGKAVYQKDVECNFCISKSTVTNILKLMEKKGYIVRVSDENDARLKRLALTELGKKKHIQTVEIIDDFHKRMEDGITEDEFRTFERVMEKIEQNMEAIK